MVKQTNLLAVLMTFWLVLGLSACWVDGVTVARSLCKAARGMKEARCRFLMQHCQNDWNIALKWCKQVGKGRTGDAGCKCDQFCGFKTRAACVKDSQCMWKKPKQKPGACHNRLTGRKGTVMNGVCPANSIPTHAPTTSPSTSPSLQPSATPTTQPSNSPSSSPTTSAPSLQPSMVPSTSPSRSPTFSPSVSPSKGPSSSPSTRPTQGPTNSPTSSAPSLSPSRAPSEVPSTAPSNAPTTTRPSNAPSTSPTVAPSRAPAIPLRAIYVAAGDYTVCAITTSNAAKCWGAGVMGELGNGVLSTSSSVPVKVEGLSSGVTSICVGAFSVCAVQNGAAKCWGYAYYGALGDGSTANSGVASPVQVIGLESGVKEVTCGGLHVCALLLDGTVTCWGDNQYGTLGDNTFVKSGTPVVAQGLTGITRISGGSRHTCALEGSTQMWCWGSDTKGELGLGSSAIGGKFPVPQLVIHPFGPNIALIATGQSTTFVVNNTVSGYGMGANDQGKLGDGTQISRDTPVKVKNFESEIGSISTASTISCAVLKTGEGYCWGRYVQTLGNGGSVQSNAPVKIAGDSNHLQISAGYAQTCSLRTNNEVWCWGDNTSGAVGDGTSGTSNHAKTPRRVVQGEV